VDKQEVMRLAVDELEAPKPAVAEQEAMRLAAAELKTA